MRTLKDFEKSLTKPKRVGRSQCRKSELLLRITFKKNSAYAGVRTRTLWVEKKLAHTQGFEPGASGLKSRHLTTRPKKSELCDLRSEMRELSPGKKKFARSHNTCLSQV